MANELNELNKTPVYDFDFQHGTEVLADVHTAYWTLKEQAPPVFWTPRNGGHWVINTAEAAVEVLRDTGRFSSRYLSIPPNPAQPTMIPESLDLPEHRPYRQLLRPFFERKAIEPLAPSIRAEAERLIDGIASQGKCEFVEAIGSRLPVYVFMEMFGLPLDQVDHFRSIVVEFFRTQGDEQRQTELSNQILGTLAQLIDLRRSEPRDDLMSALIHTDFEERKLTQEELLSIGFLMVLAGLDTVVNALTFGMRHLGSDPALRARMIDEPSAIPAIVEELMRRYAFGALPRFITQDTEIGGVQMHAGDSVLVPLATVGWDEKLNECPAEVRIDRPHCRHAGFGSGIHTCIGIHLARLEMITFYQIWAKKVGHFHLADKGPLRFRGGTVQALEELHLEWDAKAF